MRADPVDIEVVTWNIFHARDGHPDVRADWRSTVLGTPVDSGTYLHVNRTLTAAVGAILARANPTVALLQEVPPWAVEPIAERAGMSAARALTAPRVGPAGLRGRLGRANPDLFRTHEGNANVVLVRAPWQVVPGSVRAVRLNPPGLVWRTAHDRGMECSDALNWVWERRNVIVLRMRHPDGTVVQVACCHCHGDARSFAVEIPRAAAAALVAAGGLPLIFGGDLNARPRSHPEPFRELQRLGLTRLPSGDGGINHLFQRGLAGERVHTWGAHERDVTVPWRGGTRLLRVSDHAPVQATLSVTGSVSRSGSPAAP